jgi:metal-sulfur cluster biosynthetic enzyme
MTINDEVRKLLYNVIDPEIGINIVDLGLIYKIQVNEAMISVVMTLTTPGCPMHESITQWVENVLKKAYPDKEINVGLTWEPAWTPDRMSVEAKTQLGMDV